MFIIQDNNNNNNNNGDDYDDINTNVINNKMINGIRYTLIILYLNPTHYM